MFSPTPTLAEIGLVTDEREQAQLLFDFIARHLFKQGCRSADKEMCLYRGPGKRRCAVGAVIPDEMYDESHEGDTIADGAAEMLPTWAKQYISLLNSLQGVHDRKTSWDSTKKMRAGFRRVARKHQLSTLAIETMSFADR